MSVQQSLSFACVGFLLAAAAPALAGANPEQDALRAARITLSQAVATAERQTGGRSYDAGIELDHGKPRFVVETDGPNGLRTVFVDAQSGQVVGGQVVGGHSGGEPD